MKHLKLYEQFNENDPFSEEFWDYVEPDSPFLGKLKQKCPDETAWNKIKSINLSYDDFDNLIGIEKFV